MTTDTTTSAKSRAHARVGAAAGATFLALLVLGLLNSAGADETTATPRSAPQVQQQATPQPQSQQTTPGGSSGSGQRGNGFGFHHRGGGSGGFDQGGGSAAPDGSVAPSTGGTTSGSTT